MTDGFDAELDRERENGDRLAAVLKLVGQTANGPDWDDLRAILLVPQRGSQLTLGHVIDGALAMHEITVRARPE